MDAITTTDNQTIGGNLTVTGNLTINGTTVTNDATNVLVKDPLIGINNGASSNASDLGLLMERGSTGDNAFMGWDESGDFFTVGTTTGTADSTGNLTYSFANFKCAAITATSGTLAGITSLGLNAGATITDGILDEVSEGLAAIQKEKLGTLSEGVEFESEEEYREKLETLKESYFPAKGAPTAKSESLSEGVDNAAPGKEVNGSMGRYLDTLSRFKK